MRRPGQKDLSIPAQRKLLHRWAAERPEVQIVKEFADEGESAYAPADKRPGFRQMVAFCRRSSVQHILVHKLDRFSRNQEESIIFKSLLRRHGVTVKSITEVFEPETPQGFLYEGMIEVINQFYSMNLATQALKGMRENAERGHVNGGRPPYGYRIERVENGNSREHSVYVPSRRVGRDGRAATEEDERIVVPDANEALIDRDTFERRQAIAASRPFSAKNAKTQAVNWLLSRLITCDHCGSTFVGYRHRRNLKGGRVKEYRRYYFTAGDSVIPPGGDGVIPPATI